jgi:hypothetical protein
MTSARVQLEIAKFKLALQGSTELIGSIRERYAGFLTDSAQIEITLERKEFLNSQLNKDENIPEIRHLENGFIIDQAPYFRASYNTITKIGHLEFTNAVHQKEMPPAPNQSPLAFGLRRGIGVLYITLLAQDSAPGFHACALRVNGHGIIAPGDSGTGKSTFFDMFPEPMHLNDEFVIVRKTEDGPRIFSTPFSESWDKNRQNRSAKLKLLIKLKQAPNISNQPIDTGEMITILHHSSILPAGAEQEHASNFHILMDFANDLHAEELSFNLDGESVVGHVSRLTLGL